MLSSSKQKPVVLVDGSSYLFRAYHALPPLTNSKGVPTGAVYGVANMLRKLMNDYQPEHIAVVFDSKSKTFRHDLYDQYKANRTAMPDELRVQIQPLHDLIKAMGVPLIVVDGVEADDVIGTLTVQAKQAGYPVLISTGDKDLAQLVNSHVILLNTMTNVTLNEKGVVEKFGVKPSQIVDYLALVGDTSDNIPGVPKVGPKTAQKWLQQYGSLDAIVANAHEISGKVGEYLRESLSQLPMNVELVTVKCDVPLDLTPAELVCLKPDVTKLRNLFSDLEFRTWLAKLDEELPSTESQHYETVLDKKQFLTWMGKLKLAKTFALDTETTSLDAMSAELVGVSFAIGPGEAAYVPLGHTYRDAPEQLNREFVLEHLQDVLSNPDRVVIGQNLKYDMTVLANHGVQIHAKCYDTMLESYVLSGGIGRNDMESLAIKHLGKATIKYEDVAGKGSKQVTFNRVHLEEASRYAAEDADITYQLHQKMWPQFMKQLGLQTVFNQIEMPLVAVLSRMERNGVLIDPKILAARSVVIGKRIEKLEKEARDLAGNGFNLNSPKQLREVLFEQMQLPVLGKTPKGEPSTSEAVLQELALIYPLPNIILEHRSLSKLKSTYTDSLPLQINPTTGRVHTHYNQAVTSTGRLSSTDPNLQNIPIRTEEGRRIRQAFIAAEGYKLVRADYSQIELRIMAHLSADLGLVAAFRNGHDIHKATASEVFNVALEDVNDEQRRRAKAINFGLIYGMSAYGLARQISVDREEARVYMEVYFQRYPRVRAYMEDIRRKAHDQGYVETLSGRKLYLPEINSSNKMRSNAAERAAINAPMQGTAAELIKIAMINIDRWIAENAINAKMIMQVHDELVFEVAEDIVKPFTEEITKLMQTAMKLSVPIEVDCGVGDNWDAAH